MTPHPRLSRAGIELVKRFEGLRAKAARLEGGGWTIGYGHTASAREGAQVDAAQAEALLIYDLDRIARAIDLLIFTPLSRNQFNALVAFAFNVGMDNFAGSTVLKRVNQGALLQAAAAIELWRRADFRGDSLVVDGLVRRRAAEKLLFLTPPEGFTPVPTPVVRAACDDTLAPRFQGLGLTEAADLVVPLNGDQAVAERRSESPVDEAARNLATRLQAIFPEPAAPEPAAPPFAAAEPDPARSQPEPAADVPPAGASAKSSPEPVHLHLRGAPKWLAPSIGAGGALMFVGALLTMVFGMATPLNLAIGLVGVMFIIPIGLKLTRRLMGDRPAA